jgi:hypothetical protein
MKFDTETLNFLSGRAFSNGHRFDLGNRERALRRFERLVELCRGKRVLHVGCCDHLELIHEKMKRNAYLHQEICRVANRCVGSDVSARGIELMRELGFPDVFQPDEVPDEDYDICLMADVIEHVGDVVMFLRSMQRYRFKTLIVVTPNLFRARNFLSTGELINTDHRYWFSPYTLSKVLVDADFMPQRMELCHGDHASFKGAMLARVLDWFPKYRDTLIAIAKPLPLPSAP